MLNHRKLVLFSTLSLCMFPTLRGQESNSSTPATVPAQGTLEPDAPAVPLVAPPPTRLPSQPFEPDSTPPSRYATSADATTSAIGAPASSYFPGASEAADFLQSPFRWGPFQVKPSANYRFTYGSGINSGPGREQTTAQHSVSPGVVLASQHMSFGYTPTFTYYSKGDFEDTVDHSAFGRAGIGYGDWDFGISHRYRKSSDPTIETASQTDRQSHSTGLSANYRYSDKTSFDFSASQRIQLTESLNDSRTWSTMNWINYHFTERTFAGAGLGFGYVDVDTGNNMTYEQIQGRIGWRPGQKLTLDLNGGIEIRQFLDTDLSDRVNPLMGASIGYALRPTTSFSLRANRSVNTSIFANRLTESTSVALSARQIFFQRLSLSLAGGVRFVDYQSSAEDIAVDRSDEIRFFSASLGTSFLQRGSVSVFYNRSENDSNSGGFSYNSNQYGFQVGYHF